MKNNAGLPVLMSFQLGNEQTPRIVWDRHKVMLALHKLQINVKTDTVHLLMFVCDLF